MTDERVLVSADRLRGAVSKVFRACGVPSGDAHTAADCLVAADVRGVESHGVSNLVAVYVAGLRNGHIEPRPNLDVVRDRPATATLDGGRGLGVAIAPRAMDLAIDKAAAVGIGMVTVRNTRHLGMAAYHAMRALPRGMIGICLTAVGPRVVPTFGSEPMVGTNPIALAAPAASAAPFVFDAATTTVAMNRIRLAQRDGSPLPPGVVADRSGVPVMEPGAPPDDFRMLPLGATPDLGSHKGYGLACIVEILSAVLSGGPLMSELGVGHASHMLAAIDIEAFASRDEFLRSMDDFVTYLASCPTAPGHERVYYAGQREDEVSRLRRDGIPLRVGVIDDLERVGRDVGVDIGLTQVAS